MVACRCPVLLVALTVTISMLEMGSRGLQLYEEEPPSPHPLSQQILHSEKQPEPHPNAGTSADLSLVIDGSCGDQAPSDALHDPDHREVKPAHALDAASRAGRLQRTVNPWEAVLPGKLNHGGKSRKKRAALYWPSGSVFIAEFFFVIPIEAPTGVSIPFTIDVPYEFTLPNITAADFFKRENIGRDDRLNLYGVVERLFQRFGLDGRACVLRAVCERASSSLEGAGMMGEVITTILTASLSIASEGMYEYLVAEHNGRTRGDCWALYPSCPISLFNWLE
ncbi:uncharacterized protein LOC123504881 [Portunus trituberculatus]|uniref:uncharacterized protein LOC123504881 n=1 Tax=Portunus trituberculatus TaxID=210409 RepID=UPI001E1D19D7|nr:uncharacterized protein LOC123504881 [Portunus trituberculatus]